MELALSDPRDSVQPVIYDPSDANERIVFAGCDPVKIYALINSAHNASRLASDKNPLVPGWTLNGFEHSSRAATVPRFAPSRSPPCSPSIPVSVPPVLFLPLSFSRSLSLSNRLHEEEEEEESGANALAKQKRDWIDREEYRRSSAIKRKGLGSLRKNEEDE